MPPAHLADKFKVPQMVDHVVGVYSVGIWEISGTQLEDTVGVLTGTKKRPSRERKECVLYVARAG